MSKKLRIKISYLRMVIILPLLAFYVRVFNQLRLHQRSSLNKVSLLNSTDDSNSRRSLSQIARPPQKKPVSTYARDELCGKCRSIVLDEPQTCGSVIYETAYKKNLSLKQAARIEVEELNRKECQTCLPEFCGESAKKLWRYDKKAPRILQAQAHYLSSIPNEHRVPSERLQLPNFYKDGSFQPINTFFLDPNNSHPKRRYFFEYNPSLVSIPKEQIPRVEGESPVYLASYRVSTQQNCFPKDTTVAMLGGSWANRPTQYDYLGLALLRSDLTIIQDVVLELPKSHFGRREDFRLFSIHGQIYVATYCQIVPLWINGVNAPQSKHIAKIVKPVFPSPLQITMRKNPSFCSQELEDIKFAKSLNYFVDQYNKTLVEMQPTVPHIVNKLDLSITSKSDAPSKANAFTDNNIPDPSFYTSEQANLANNKNFFGHPFTKDRGGACCIPFLDPSDQSKKLLLGVSHVKTMLGSSMPRDVVKMNHYLSRFYAIESAAPYSMVARTGFFCLPAHPSPVGSEGNPFAELPVHNPLDIAGSRYESCSAIHFITGMTEKVRDPEKLIISYGVNDCTPWFIEVNKADILSILFPASIANVALKTEE